MRESLRGLKGCGFRAAVHDKDTLRDLLERIPVRVVLDWRVGLLGAAGAAADAASGSR
mgnify:CR=1 FL=1